MSRTLSRREKVLAGLVGGSVLLVINIFVFDYFLSNRTSLTVEKARKAAQLQSMQALLATTPLWEERDRWLKSKQPHLENEATAGVQLLNQVQEAARKQSVTVEQPVIGEVEQRAYCTAVTIDLETKSTWKALVAYLAELQTPEQFVVLESANLHRDPNDETQMRGKFRISKWFAPK